jgi:hypothetical protein
MNWSLTLWLLIPMSMLAGLLAAKPPPDQRLGLPAAGEAFALQAEALPQGCAPLQVDDAPSAALGMAPRRGPAEGGDDALWDTGTRHGSSKEGDAAGMPVSYVAPQAARGNGALRSSELSGNDGGFAGGKGGRSPWGWLADDVMASEQTDASRTQRLIDEAQANSMLERATRRSGAPERAEDAFEDDGVDDFGDWRTESGRGAGRGAAGANRQLKTGRSGSDLRSPYDTRRRGAQ